MDIKKTLFSVLVILVNLFSSAFAQTRSSITLNMGADNDSGRSYYVSGYYGFENGLLLKAGTGESSSTDTQSGEVSSEFNNIGIQSDPSALLSVGLDKSTSLQVGSIDIDSISLTLELNTLDWNMFVSSVNRNVSIKTVASPRIRSFESDGMIVGISYYGWDPVYLSFGEAIYDYPSRISVVNTRINLFTYIFGTTTVNQIFALEDRHSNIEVGYYFDKGSVAVSRSEGRSVIDRSISTVNTLYLSYNVNSNWVLSSSTGISKIDISSDSTVFVSLSLSYRW